MERDKGWLYTIEEKWLTSLLLHYTSCHVEKQAIEAIWNLYGKAILQACFEVWNMILVSNVDYACKEIQHSRTRKEC